MSTTAIYVRQSEDKSGQEAAVQRQETACRLIAQGKGWDEPVMYADNSFSATSGKTRPAFERLVADVERGTITHIVVWHLDRLTRSMKDLTRIIDAGQKHRLNIATVQGQSLNLGDPTGIAVAQIITAIAAMETAHKSERQVASNLQRAEKGESFWTRRPFGYDRKGGNKVVIVPKEAAAIREAAELILGGATLTSVVKKWNDAGFRTTDVRKDKDGKITKDGGLWGVTQLRRLLLNPRYCGRRIYTDKEDVTHETPGKWKAILDPETSRRLEEKLTDPRRRTAPDDLNSKYLLSGIAVCGKCGAKMFAAPVPAKGGGKRMVYRCFGGYCMQRSMAEIDEYVSGTVVGILARPDAASLFASGETIAELRKKATDKRDDRDLLADLLLAKQMSRAVVREKSAKLTKEINEIEAMISAAETPAAAVVGAEDVAKAWDAEPLGNQRQIIRALMDVTVLPAGKGRSFATDQVRLTPRD